MLLGQSIFQSVVERLSREETEEAEREAEAQAYRVAGLNTGFVQETSLHGRVPTQSIAAAQATKWAEEQYLELMPDEESVVEEGTRTQEPETPPEMPAHLARLDPEQVAEDLGIASDDSVASLNAKRRAFARLNHPDQVHPLFVEAAHTRMTLANRLVDQALQRATLTDAGRRAKFR